MKNTKTFVNENKVKAIVEYADCNPHMENDNWKANHYKVALKFNRRQLTVYFSQGLGITQDPTADSVLDCLAMDAYTYVNNESFEDFCSNYGYDEDSRKAERTYKTIMNQSKKLERFLGAEKLDDLLNNYERL